MKASDMINIIAWLFIILAVFFIIWKIIGGSPTELSILIALITGVLFKMMGISSDLSALKEKVRNIDNKFSALASDFKAHVNHK